MKIGKDFSFYFFTFPKRKTTKSGQFFELCVLSPMVFIVIQIGQCGNQLGYQLIDSCFNSLCNKVISNTMLDGIRERFFSTRQRKKHC